MRTPRLPFVVLVSTITLAGCRPPAPTAARLPDTPEMAPPPKQSSVEFGDEFGPAEGPVAGSERPDVRAAREQAERHARLFANSENPRRGGARSKAPLADQAFLEEPTASGSRNAVTPPSVAELAARNSARTFSRPSPTPLVPPKSEPSVPAPSAPEVVPTQPTTLRQPLQKDGGLLVPPIKPELPPAAGNPADPKTAGDGPKFMVPLGSTLSSGTTDQDVMLRDLSHKAKEQPTDIVAQLNLQLFKLLKNEVVPQQESISQLAPSDREILTALLDAVSIFRTNAMSDPNALPSVTVKPLLRMADQLRERVELSIPTILLCQKVDAYGIYEPMPLEFRAGMEHETIIYCEVENFTSRKNDKNLWETKLSMEAVLYNSAGDAVLKGKDAVPTDVCRNRRRDFFVVKRLKLPRSLGAARYILKLTIVDEHSKRIAENSLNIMMMAQ